MYFLGIEISHAGTRAVALDLESAVIRAEAHPARPEGYAPLDGFWRGRGYAPVPGLVTELAWKEHGEAAESPKPMQYWMRTL